MVVGDGRGIASQPEPGGEIHALLGATHAGPPIGDRELDRWPGLRLIAKYTIGTDDVDLDAATARGILVTHSPTEANWGGVAEGTIAYLLALTKKLVARDRAVRDGGWRAAALEGRYLGAREDGYPGLTIGIVGLGRIGRRVARLLSSWQIPLIGTDPYVDDATFASSGVERVGLESLLSRSDVVTLHCSLTDETRGLLDRAAIAAMPSGAMLINTARGAIVDLEALCDGLESGRIAAAALDVFPEEPLPAPSRIRSFGDRVLLSPHMVAANEGGTLQAAVPWATDAVLSALRGEIPEHVYNAAAVERWQRRFGGRSLLGQDPQEDREVPE